MDIQSDSNELAEQIYERWFSHLPRERIMEHLHSRLSEPGGRTRLLEDITTEYEKRKATLEVQIKRASMTMQELEQELDRLNEYYLSRLKALEAMFE